MVGRGTFEQAGIRLLFPTVRNGSNSNRDEAGKYPYGLAPGIVGFTKFLTLLVPLMFERFFAAIQSL